MDKPLADDAYHIRFQYETVEAMPVYNINQIIPIITGQVLTTRAEQWQAEMQAVMDGQVFDLKADRVSPSYAEIDLPNPFALIYQQNILNQRRDIRVSNIHGDLNLENILVDPDVKMVHLIDFAEAHWDYVLHDLLRLETEVISKLIPPALQKNNLSPESIGPFYEHLHYASFQSNPSYRHIQAPHPSLEPAFAALKIIRQIVYGHGLFNPRQYEEYYQGLVFVSLGGLKISQFRCRGQAGDFLGGGYGAKFIAKPLTRHPTFHHPIPRK